MIFVYKEDLNSNGLFEDYYIEIDGKRYNSGIYICRGMQRVGCVLYSYERISKEEIRETLLALTEELEIEGYKIDI